MHKKDLDELKPNKHGVRISSRLGGRKKIDLIETAMDRGFRVFNLGIDMQTDFEDEFGEFEELEEDQDDLGDIEDEDLIDEEQE